MRVRDLQDLPEYDLNDGYWYEDRKDFGPMYAQDIAHGERTIMCSVPCRENGKDIALYALSAPGSVSHRFWIHFSPEQAKEMIADLQELISIIEGEQ